MLDRTVTGTASEVVPGLEALVKEVQADELILVNLAVDEKHKTPHPADPGAGLTVAASVK